MATYRTTFSIHRLWLILCSSMVLMFGVLLYVGGQIYQAMPPIKRHFIVRPGSVVYTREDIERGQNVWQSLGGMQQGSMWGHRSCLASNSSADWLHREAAALLPLLAPNIVGDASLADEQRLELQKVALRKELRTNTYASATETATLSRAGIRDRARRGTLPTPVPGQWRGSTATSRCLCVS